MNLKLKLISWISSAKELLDIKEITKCLDIVKPQKVKQLLKTKTSKTEKSLKSVKSPSPTIEWQKSGLGLSTSIASNGKAYIGSVVPYKNGEYGALLTGGSTCYAKCLSSKEEAISFIETKLQELF
jgi:hypothetical protein